MQQASTYYKNLLQSGEARSFITTRHITEPALLKTESCNWPVYRMDQVHSNHFEVVTDQHNPAEIISGTDALITFQKQILLRVKVADCLPVLAYFPDKAIAAIHSGRASTKKNIVGRVLQYIKVNHAPILPPTLWLGPCICYNCYQIDRVTDLHYDLRGKVVSQIYEVYPEANILHLNSCTLEGPKWFSYRENGTAERMFGYVGRK